jgi:hypothetical protein
LLRVSLSRNLASTESIKPSTGWTLQLASCWALSAIVALLCTALIGRAIRSAKKRESDSHVQCERAALYEALMALLVALVSGSSGGRNGKGDLSAVERALFLRGSVSVNNEYRRLLRLLSEPGADEKVVRSQITRFFLTLRRECGGSTYGLEDEDWSDLVRLPMHRAPSERSSGAPSAHFTAADAAPPAHRLSPRG